MSKARHVWPTDLVALVSWEGQVYGNEAWPWERFGKEDEGPHPLESAIEQWFSLATGGSRDTLVHVQGQTLRGLVSTRRRSSKSVREINCLIAVDPDVCLGLLDRLCESGGRAGVERLFLRLAADSPLLAMMQRAGFVSYGREQLWWRRPARQSSGGSSLSVRQPTPEDNFNLFRLYSAAIPSVVRQAEGPTMKEWLAVQERKGWSKDLVVERDGSLVGWMRFTRGNGATKLGIVLHPDEGEKIDDYISSALTNVSNRQAVFCLVPNYAPELGSTLSRYGFQAGGEYVSLLRRLARPVAIVERVPNGAQEGYTLPTLLTKP